jgi:DNA modification methylase
MAKENYEYSVKPIGDLIPYANNSRTHNDEQVNQIASSIKEFGFTNPVLIDEDGGIVAGHGRVMAAGKLNISEVPCIVLAGLTEAQKKAYIIADNQLPLNADWDLDMLRLEVEALKELDFDLDIMGFDDGFLDDLFGDDGDDPYADGVAGSMSENFGQPPFSILDTRKGDWLERKKLWRDRIGDNGESREGTLSEGGMVGEMNNGVSLLDPVMAEIIVMWFGKIDGVAFDPFAGDSVFGFVAGTIGMQFQGIELRKEQADLNAGRCNAAGLPCVYHNDTSENMNKYINDESVDLVFSCPPYADLEVYSDDPNDLSTMDHDSFFAVYKRILINTFQKLKQNRFAVIVMGEVRGKDGQYIGTIPNTIKIMEEAGYGYYNEIVLVNSAGTLPLRAGKSMRASRKVGKMHQNVMVFCKGDPAIAAKELGDIRAKIDFEGECDEV